MDPIIVPSPPRTSIKSDCDIFFMLGPPIELIFVDETRDAPEFSIVFSTEERISSVFLEPDKITEILLIFFIVRRPISHNVDKYGV